MDIPAWTYMRAGFLLRSLRFTQTMHCQTLIEQIPDLIKHLEALSFSFPRGQLNAVFKKVEALKAKSGKDANPTSDIVSQLQTLVTSLIETIEPAARARRLIQIEETDICTTLNAYATSHTLNPTQKHLLAETTRSLETGAYRAGLVMGWAFGYDRFRRWIFDDMSKRALFNKELTKPTKSGKTLYKPITTYEQFFEGRPGEAEVIDLCAEAKLINTKVHDDLRHWLRRRNEHAHASDKKPTLTKATALIEHVLEILETLKI